MAAPEAFSRWWKLVPVLALALGVVAWGRLGLVALHNVSPPHSLRIEGVEEDQEGPWFRCHPDNTVIDGAGLWAVWQCGLGSEGRAHLVRLDLDALQVQRRWPLPAPYDQALRLQLWGVLVDGSERILLLEHTKPDSGRIPEETMLVLQLHPAGGLDLLARLPREAESPYHLLAWARNARGFDFVYDDGSACHLGHEDAWSCEALMPEAQGETKRLFLEGAWRDQAGAWWAVWQKEYRGDGPDELVLLGPGHSQGLKGVTRKRQELDTLVGNVLRSGGSWQVRDGRLVHPQPPALPDGERLPPGHAGTPLIQDGAMTRQRSWTGQDDQRIVRLGDELFRMDMGFDGLRFGRDLSQPGPLVVHEDLTAVITTFAVRHRERFWILHHNSLSAVIMDAQLRPQPLGFGQRFLRLLPSNEGDMERLMRGVGPNVMSFWKDRDLGSQLLVQFSPLVIFPAWPFLILLLVALPFRRRFAVRVSYNVLAGMYLLYWAALGRNFWLITSWF